MNEEELKQISQMLNDTIVKIDGKISELSRTIGKTVENKKEYVEGKINENSFAYVAGAFVGGVVVGYVASKVKCRKTDIEKVR